MINPSCPSTNEQIVHDEKWKKSCKHFSHQVKIQDPQLGTADLVLTKKGVKVSHVYYIDDQIKIKWSIKTIFKEARRNILDS